MASGFGLTGGPSRCFPFWQEVVACYVLNSSSDNPAGARKCSPVLDDYYECLHHKKEMARAIAMAEAMRKAEKDARPSNPPTASEIRGLGMLGQEHTTAQFLEKQKQVLESKQ